MRVYIKVIPEREWFNHCVVIERDGKTMDLWFQETYTKNKYFIPANLTNYGQSLAEFLSIQFTGLEFTS